MAKWPAAPGTLPTGEASTRAPNTPWALSLAVALFLFSIPMESAFMLRLDQLEGMSILSLSRATGLALFAVAFYYRRICFKCFPRSLYLLGVYLLIAFARLCLLSRTDIFACSLPLLTYIQMGVAFLIVFNYFQHWRGHSGGWWGYVVGTCVASLLQVSGLARVEFAGLSDRVGAFDCDPNFYAAGLAAGFLMMVHLTLLDWRPPIWQKTALRQAANWGRWLVLALCFVVLKAIIATGSRGVLLALVGSLPLLVFFQRGSLFIRLVRVGALATFVFVGFYQIQSGELVDRWMRTVVDGDVSLRDNLARNSFEMLLEKPVFGYGPSEATRVLGDRGGTGNLGAHNLFLDIAIRLGLLGLVPYMLFVGACGVAALQCYSRARDALPISLFVMAIFVSVSLAFDIHKTFWVILGYCLAVRISPGKRSIRSQLSPLDPSSH
jgi:O-antigen ligase